MLKLHIPFDWGSRGRIAEPGPFELFDLLNEMVERAQEIPPEQFFENVSYPWRPEVLFSHTLDNVEWEELPGEEPPIRFYESAWGNQPVTFFLCRDGQGRGMCKILGVNKTEQRRGLCRKEEKG